MIYGRRRFLWLTVRCGESLTSSSTTTTVVSYRLRRRPQTLLLCCQHWTVNVYHGLERGRGGTRYKQQQLQQQHYYHTVSFSGAGHLLSYHLGVAQVLRKEIEQCQQQQQQQQQQRSQPPFEIHGVSGSSSGAIAAVCLALLPSSKLDTFIDRFVNVERGRAFSILQDTLLEIEQQQQQQQQQQEEEIPHHPILLSIATTRCSDGGLHLHNFWFDNNHRKESSSTKMIEDIPCLTRPQHWSVTSSSSSPSSTSSSSSSSMMTISTSISINPPMKHLLRAVQASCTIPRSFHPVDVFQSSSSSSLSSYPDEEGIDFDGTSYVDGGIIAPVPPTLIDLDQHLLLERQRQRQQQHHQGSRRSRSLGDDDVDNNYNIHSKFEGRIIVSPISGYCNDETNFDENNNNNTETTPMISIRPTDTSFTLPLVPKSWTTIRRVHELYERRDDDDDDVEENNDGNDNDPNQQPCKWSSTLYIRPSIQNVRALVVSMGLVHPSVLKDWYSRGIDDVQQRLFSRK